MAQPLRFRYSPESWSDQRVRSQLLTPLREGIGARSVDPRFPLDDRYRTYRFEMTNGDLALFATRDEEAYWLGNTETPKALWRTEKIDWDDTPYPVARWAQRELLETLHDEDPWLADYPHLSWFFLPVFMSKDGRDTSRAFFREHAAGFPDADWRDAAGYFEAILHTGVLDPYRHTMAGKLGTSQRLDAVRMSAAMSEFITAKILIDAGYTITPEASVTTGHNLDFRATNGDTNVLVEVTRPMKPKHRAASGPVAAVRETAATKTTGQLKAHGGGVVLFVDCSSFPSHHWHTLRNQQPAVRHRPAVVYHAHPDHPTQAYRKGNLPLDLTDSLHFIG